MIDFSTIKSNLDSGQFTSQNIQGALQLIGSNITDNQKLQLVTSLVKICLKEVSDAKQKATHLQKTLDEKCNELNTVKSRISYLEGLNLANLEKRLELSEMANKAQAIALSTLQIKIDLLEKERCIRSYDDKISELDLHGGGIAVASMGAGIVALAVPVIGVPLYLVGMGVGIKKGITGTRDLQRCKNAKQSFIDNVDGNSKKPEELFKILNEKYLCSSLFKD